LAYVDDDHYTTPQGQANRKLIKNSAFVALIFKVKIFLQLLQFPAEFCSFKSCSPPQKKKVRKENWIRMRATKELIDQVFWHLSPPKRTLQLRIEKSAKSII
jgi:hypothetical protein